jgi:hypothetical protein
MTTGVSDWQMAIYTRVQESVPNNKVFLEGVPESTEVPMDPTGMVKPFAILWFGQMYDFAGTAGAADLCGNGGTNSVRTAAFAIQAVAPTGLSLLQFEDAIRGGLFGFKPAGHGEVNEGGATTIRDPLPTGLGVGLRFYKTVFYSGMVGMQPIPA